MMGSQDEEVERNDLKECGGRDRRGKEAQAWGGESVPWRRDGGSSGQSEDALCR